MKRTTIMLPSELKTKAIQKANQKGISLGELIRESLEVILNNPEGYFKDDPLFADDAVFHDQGPEDLARNHDHYLLLVILRSGQEEELMAIDLFEKYADQGVSFTDCLSFVLMDKRKLKRVFSFDQHFERAGFTLCP